MVLVVIVAVVVVVVDVVIVVDDTSDGMTRARSMTRSLRFSPSRSAITSMKPVGAATALSYQLTCLVDSLELRP